MNRRNSYNNDISAFPGLYQPQYNYQSMYVDPINLDLVREYNKDKQARFDATTNAIAQTQAGLYDSETFDPKEKEALIQRMNSQFDKVYKDYSGDMSAATNDIIKMIADVRRDEYFDINKYALEQQKAYNASRQQYGAEGVDFTKQFPSTLRDPNTKALYGRNAFAYDIVKDPGMEKKAADIWEDALQQASFESGLRSTQGGKFLESITKFGKGIDVGGKDQVDSKLDKVYNEYLSTPEGQLRARVMRELEGITSDAEVEEQMKSWLRDIGKARVAPTSIKYDRVGNPDYRATSGTSSEKPNRPMVPTEDITIPDPTGQTGKDLRKLIADPKHPLHQEAKNKVIRTLYQAEGSKMPGYEKVLRQEITQALNTIDKGNFAIFGRKYTDKSPASTYALANLDQVRNFLKGVPIYNLDDAKLNEQIEQLRKRVIEAKRQERGYSPGGAATLGDASIKALDNTLKSLKQMRGFYDKSLDDAAAKGIDTKLWAFDPIENKNNHLEHMTKYLDNLGRNKLVDLNENKDLETIGDMKFESGSFMGLDIIPGYGVVTKLNTYDKDNGPRKSRILRVADPTASRTLIRNYDAEVGGKFSDALTHQYTVVADDPTKIAKNETGETLTLNGSVAQVPTGYVIARSDGKVYTVKDFITEFQPEEYSEYFTSYGEEGLNRPFVFETLGKVITTLGLK